MKTYEKPDLKIQLLFENDVIRTSVNPSPSDVNACDDSGSWNTSWSTLLGGHE